MDLDRRTDCYMPFRTQEVPVVALGPRVAERQSGYRLQVLQHGVVVHDTGRVTENVADNTAVRLGLGKNLSAGAQGSWRVKAWLRPAPGPEPGHEAGRDAEYETGWSALATLLVPLWDGFDHNAKPIWGHAASPYQLFRKSMKLPSGKVRMSPADDGPMG